VLVRIAGAGRSGAQLSRACLVTLSVTLLQVTRSADILPVLDEWAMKLYREMDYRKEAAMMERFATDLKPLSGILVPKAYPDLVTRRVLCTEWIEGEKLSESRADDVKQLCTTLLNAYLIQLLDTGLLHADPHPGNLIRTPDGRICILDYGAPPRPCVGQLCLKSLAWG
jgi:aarF domain-containing kinase